MNNKNGLSEISIASKLRSGKQFFVASAYERYNVLRCAKFLGLNITTKQRGDKSGWDVVPVLKK